jgi:THO complex subunit 4
MSGKLDQSLDEILSTQRRSAVRGRRGRRVPTAGRTTAVVPPVGGIKKTTKQARGGIKAVPTGPSGGNGDSKIQVSNLPKDVNEAQIKEYFVKAVGPTKRVEISYGPGGVSRGIVNITFARSDGATKALSALNGVLVDGKPMKIDVILDARSAASIPPPKGLSDRIAQPKAQPKSAATTKTATDAAGARGKGRAGRRGGKAGRNPRPAKKTAEELDSEMADYFDNGGPAAGTETAATTNGAAQPAANGDAAMDDEIL